MKTRDTQTINLSSTALRVYLPVLHAFRIFLLLYGAALSALAPASDLGLTEADCRCCHGATLADRHHLMVIDRELECLGCHQMTWNSTTLHYDITVTRDCLQCHTGSLADRHHLLVDQVNYNCFSCHTIAWDPDTVMYVAQFNASCDTSSTYPPSLSATINGTVSNASGSGLAWVQITTDDPNHTTLTTETGRFQLATIPPGEYLLTASADGYISSSQTVTVAENQTLTVELVLHPLTISPTITGLVMDSNQTPIEDAIVFSDNDLYSTRTNADGYFSLINLAAGDITLTAQRDGYGSTTQSILVALGQNLTTEFVLPDFPMEVCNDGVDNDSNNYIDCDDPVCASTAACQNPVEICGDDLDNDANGLTDCSDLTCMGTANCPQPIVEICDDNIDNNSNNLIDCADPECSLLAHCLTELCADGVDNNGDTLIDCADPVCASTSHCIAPPVEICDDGLDNDADGELDCADDKCMSKPICLQPGGDENPNSSSCEYIVQSEWDSGFTAVIRIHNRGLTPINGWEVNWEYTDNSTIGSTWNADISGSNPYTANSLNWNSVIYPGKSAEFGILGDKSPPLAQVPLLTGPTCDANDDLICEYVVHGEWNNGFNAAIRLYNGGSAPIQGWEVDWAYSDASTVNHFWSANLSGSNPYKATNLDWNSIIHPGSSVNFGVTGQKRTMPAQIPTVTGTICDITQ